MTSTLWLMRYSQDERHLVSFARSSGNASWAYRILLHNSLDSMGLAGFSHDFGSLDGKNSEVASQFTRLMNIPFTLLNIIVFLLQPVIPALMYIPSERTRARTDLKAATGRLARQLLNNLAGSEDAVDGKSILGLISRSIFASLGNY